MIFQGKSNVLVKEAVLHCAAIRTGQFEGYRPFQVFTTINRWHKERGFKNGFGYHGIFMPDGTFYSGRPLQMVGAHVMGRNLGTWGLLLIESKQIKPRDDGSPGQFDDYYTEAQGRAVRAWLRMWPQLEKVSGHNDYAPKLCPGFKVKSSDWI